MTTQNEITWERKTDKDAWGHMNLAGVFDYIGVYDTGTNHDGQWARVVKREGYRVGREKWELHGYSHQGCQWQPRKFETLRDAKNHAGMMLCLGIIQREVEEKLRGEAPTIVLESTEGSKLVSERELRDVLRYRTAMVEVLLPNDVIMCAISANELWKNWWPSARHYTVRANIDGSTVWLLPCEDYSSSGG